MCKLHISSKQEVTIILKNYCGSINLVYVSTIINKQGSLSLPHCQYHWFGLPGRWAGLALPLALASGSAFLFTCLTIIKHLQVIL